MFHWICPECGRECLPATRECPDCSDAVVEAHNTAPAWSSSAMVESGQAERGRGEPVAVAAVLDGGPPSTPPRAKWRSLFTSSPWTAAAPEPHLTALAHHVATAEIETVLPSLEIKPNAKSRADGAAEAAETPFVVPLVAPVHDADPLHPAGRLDVVPPAIRNAMAIVAVAPALPVATGIAVLCGGLYSLRGQPTAGAIVLPESPYPSWYPQKSAALPDAKSLFENSFALPPLTFERRETPISASRGRPTIPDLALRSPGLIASLRRQRMYPAGAPNIARSVPAPQITLPGPKLPRQLEHFEHGGVVARMGPNRGSKPAPMPGWLITLSATLTVVVSCIALTFYILPALSASRTQSDPPTVSAYPQASSPVSAASSPGPGKALEVTGFRVGIDLANKTVIQYIVVNHSSTDISGATVDVSLKAARGHFQRSPLASFSFRLPTIGPLESREMTTVLDTRVKPGEIPEWQTLRPEIRVTP